MEEGIIEILREKEKEMEKCVREAKQRGAKIMENALTEALEIKERMAGEVEIEIASTRDSEERRLKKELLEIEKENEQAVAALKAKASARKTEAMDFVTDFILGVTDDSC